MDASSVLSDDDYDVVSNPGQRSLESSIADYGHIPGQTVHEPAPSQTARDKFETISWTAADVQANVRRALGVSSLVESSESPTRDGTIRVYVDGIFDAFNAGYATFIILFPCSGSNPHITLRHALQLRQAKLSFPSVYLMVGIFSDELLQQHGYAISVPHVERCEVLRHCRWVDEVVLDAPWVVSGQTLENYLIDYVALDEGTSVDPGCDKARLKGYDEIKALGVL
jgi:choline-phosphate cytidylyltransferase